MVVAEHFSVRRRSPVAVFIALLCFEFRTRGPVLASVLVALWMCALVAHFGRFGVGAETRGVAQILALFGIVYCGTFRGTENTFRPDWSGFPLPIRTRTLVTVSIAFQCSVSALVALPWSVAVFSDNDTFAFTTQFLALTLVASQVQALSYWCVGAGIIGGALWYVVGLVLTVIMCLLVSWPPLMLPTLSLATVAGWTSSGLAATFIRKESAPFGRFRYRRPYTAPHALGPVEPSDTVRDNPHTLPRAIPRLFPSPLYAQVWFELRSSALWLAAPILVAPVVLMLLHVLEGGLGADLLVMSAYVGVAIVFSLKHNRLGTPQASFVSALPMSNQSLGHAKLLGVLLAFVPTASVSLGVFFLLSVVGFGWPRNPGIDSQAFLLAILFVVSVYGHLAIGAQIVSPFMSIVPALLSSYIVVEFIDSNAEFLDLVKPRAPGLDAVSYLLALWFVIRRHARLKGLDFNWPLELRVAIVLLLPLPLLHLALYNSPLRELVQLWHVWVSPFPTLALLLAYGVRMHFIGARDVAGALVCYLALYTLFGFDYATNPTDAPYHTVDFGHLCVLLVSPVVWYPFIVASQRHASATHSEA